MEMVIQNNLKIIIICKKKFKLGLDYLYFLNLICLYFVLNKFFIKHDQVKFMF